MKRPQRKPQRMAGFDYSKPGRYSITICTFLKAPLLGHLINGRIVLTDIGITAAACWEELPEQYHGISIGPMVVMPNHIHGIIEIHTRSSETDVNLSLPDIVRNYKAFTAHAYYTKTNQRKLWHRGYFEHVIRDEADYHRIEEYIKCNPATWARDKYYLE